MPIETASQDRLRRSPLVNRVAELLGDGAVPVGRVFAIRGDWGTGKSSFKNLIVERLAARADPPLQLQFNPWQWRDADAISRALYLEIADRLGTGWSRNASRRASKLRRYGAVLTGAGASAGKVPEGGAATVLGSGAVVAMAASVGLGLPSAAFVAGALATAAIALTMGGKLLTVLGRDRGGEPLEDVRTGSGGATHAADLRKLASRFPEVDAQVERLRAFLRADPDRFNANVSFHARRRTTSAASETLAAST